MNRADTIAIASAPMRISLAGGGTDLPSYAERFGGSVVSLAIEHRVTVAASPWPGEDLFELLGEGHRIDHRELMREGFAPAAMRRIGVGGAQLACVSTAPPCSGLGGSGAFLVALVRALRAGQALAPAALAEEASTIEMTDLGRPVGKHDHYVAAFGGLRVLRIGRDGDVSTETVRVSDELAGYVAERLLLFHTGLRHDAGAVLGAQDRQTRSSDSSTLDRLHAIHSLVRPLLEAIEGDRLEQIGPILNEHWCHKARLSDAVAAPRATELYDLALESGSDGGKLLGAGGGGFMLFSCRPGQQRRLRAAMTAAGATELRFAASAEGVRLRLEPPGGALLEPAGATEVGAP